MHQGVAFPEDEILVELRPGRDDRFRLLILHAPRELLDLPTNLGGLPKVAGTIAYLRLSSLSLRHLANSLHDSLLKYELGDGHIDDDIRYFFAGQHEVLSSLLQDADGGDRFPSGSTSMLSSIALIEDEIIVEIRQSHNARFRLAILDAPHEFIPRLIANFTLSTSNFRSLSEFLQSKSMADSGPCNSD